MKGNTEIDKVNDRNISVVVFAKCTIFTDEKTKL